jgi:signal transduction histidine kinase/CheY-like chemotaxis protein
MEITALLGTGDTVERENAKLRRIVEVLMRRVEQKVDADGSGFSHFETAIMLERQVRARTRDLEEALELLNETNGRLAAAMRETEEARANLANALEAVEEGFALFDAGDRLVRRNSRFAAMVPDVLHLIEPGITYADYVEAVSGSACLCVPSGFDREGWEAERLAAHRRRSVTYTLEFRGDRWFQVSEQRTPDGGTTVLQTDVTNMVRLEREERDKMLDRQSRVVRATLDHIEQGVAIFDADGRLAGWNARLQQLVKAPARLLRQGTRFETILDVLETGNRFAPSARPGALVSWVRHQSRRRPLRIELTGRDGTVLDVHCEEMPDRSFVISCTDVTREREAARALHRANETLEQRVAERTAELLEARDVAERANASKSRFVAAASHDLLQPLNAAKLFIASLIDHDLTRPQRAIAERIHCAFGSIETLLGALLDISKLDSGQVSTEVSEFPLERLLQPLRTDFAETARAKGLRLTVLPSSAVVASDPAYLQRILQNLVSNALRYTARGRVVVGARRDGGFVRIVVQDTGPGIAEADRAVIFQEFKRLDHQNAGLPGMGLGLAIVDRACRLLGHDLALESEPGRGTRFSVSVPVTAWLPRRAQPDAAGHAGAARDIPDLEGMIILVVEDDAQVRTAMTGLLEQWGASPVAAASAAEARALVAELGLTPDAVIADHHLGPGENGLDLIRDLRREAPADCAFLGVLTTADRSPGVRERALRASVHLRLKPVDPAGLAALLERAKPRL